ncbi:MAG: hypothetical protein P8Z30_19630 [Acidobacteriota bacterium]
MKRSCFVVFFILLFGSFAWAMDINADISNSTITVSDSTTFRVHNMALSAPEINASGTFWVDFQWDPVTYTFVPVNAGAETATTGKTWSWPVSDYLGTALFSITSDPVNRVFHISFSWISYMPKICPTIGITFLQGNNEFGISSSSDDTHARITWTSNFDGCGLIYSGQTVTATISELPSWFNFADTFAVARILDTPTYCEPDGTYHK